MSEAKFTKGDWSYDADTTFIETTETISNGSNIICDMLTVDNSEEELANAHLIAAAPEMYKMLEMSANILSGDDYENEVSTGDIRALLSKARGES